MMYIPRGLLQRALGRQHHGERPTQANILPIIVAITTQRVAHACDLGWESLPKSSGDMVPSMDLRPTLDVHVLIPPHSTFPACDEGRFTLRWRRPPVGQECLAKTWLYEANGGCAGEELNAIKYFY